MKMDEFPVLGHQMTHSIDSYITDSANSASALYTGHKSTVNAMGYVIKQPIVQSTGTDNLQCLRRLLGGPLRRPQGRDHR